MAKKTPGEEILEAIIAKGKGPAAEQARAELIGYKETKQQLAAAIKPSLSRSVAAAPAIERSVELVGQPGIQTESSRGVASDIRDLKKSSKDLLDVTKKNQGTLENLLKLSSKYYENNNELLKNLLVANDLNAARNREQTKELSASIGKSGTAGPSLARSIIPDTGPGMQFPGIDIDGVIPGTGRGKQPKGKPPSKPKPDSAKKRVGKAAAVFAAVTALGLGAGWAFAYLTGSDEEKKEMLDALGDKKDQFLSLINEGVETAGAAVSEAGTAAKQFIEENAIPLAAGGAAGAALLADTVARAEYADATKTQPPKPAPAQPKGEIKTGVDKRGRTYSYDSATGRRVKSSPEQVNKKIEEKIAEKVSKKGVGVVAKSLPFVGALVGLTSAGIEFAKGNNAAAAKELGLAGLAATGPWGSTASLAIQLGELAYDVYNDLKEEEPDLTIDDVKAKLQDYFANKFTIAPSEPMADLSAEGMAFGPNAEPPAPAARPQRPAAQAVEVPEYDALGNPIGTTTIVPSAIEKPARLDQLNQGGGGATVNIVQGGTTVNNNVMGGGRSMEMPSGTATPTAPTNPWDFSLYGQRGVRPTY